jgi:hypothetical protein
MPLETYTLQQTARPDGPSRLSLLRFWRLTKWNGGKLGVSQRGWTWGIVVTCSTILFAYLKVGVHTIEKATEVLSGGYLKHVLDLALWTPPELIPPTARRLLSGVRHLVEAVDCGRLLEQLAVP